MSKENLVSTTKTYYDSADADEFYFQIWGGEDIHVGLYNSPGEDISSASKRTVEKMAEKAKIEESTRILDIGAGYGGAARYIADKYGCRVVCLNLSEKENNRNKEKNKASGLDHLITVDEGNFEDLPYEEASFDLVWCQDAILHSDNKRKVLQEVDRVLKKGGRFIFTDPMQSDDCPGGVLEPILARIHLKEMGSVAKYRDIAADLGWSEVRVYEMADHLTNHYTRVREELIRNEENLKYSCSPEYIDKMKAGLQHWIDGGKNEYLNWGIMIFEK